MTISSKRSALTRLGTLLVRGGAWAESREGRARRTSDGAQVGLLRGAGTWVSILAELLSPG